MVVLIMMDLKNPLLCPFSILVTSWGESFCFPWMRMGSESELPSLTKSTSWIKPKPPEKTSSGSNPKLMENNLMILSPTTNSWSIYRTPWILDKLKMDSTDSSLSKTTDVHTFLLTLNTLEVVTTYLWNGKLGR